MAESVLEPELSSVLEPEQDLSGVLEPEPQTESLKDSLLNGQEWLDTLKKFEPNSIVRKIAGVPQGTPFIPDAITKPVTGAIKSTVGDIAGSLPGATPGFRKAAEGLAEGSTDTALGFATPDAMVGGAAIKAGGVIGQAAKAAFASQMASQAPAAYDKLKQAAKHGDESDIAKAVVEVAADTGLPLEIVKAEAFPKSKPLPPEFGNRLTMPEGAKPAVLEEESASVPAATPTASGEEMLARAIDESPVISDKDRKLAQDKLDYLNRNVNPNTLEVGQPQQTQNAGEQNANSQNVNEVANVQSPSQSGQVIPADTGQGQGVQRGGAGNDETQENVTPPELEAKPDLTAVPPLPVEAGAIADRTPPVADNPNAQSPTRLANETTDAERKARGLDPLFTKKRQSDPQTWDLAMQQIDADPTAPEKLLEDLSKNPRGPTDVETMMLLHRKTTLRNSADAASAELAKAVDSGDTEAAASARVKANAASDALGSFEEFSRQVAGRQAGASLRARRVLMNNDYSLAQMELDKRTDIGGRQLTDNERADIKKQYDDLTAKQKALEDYDSKLSEREARLRTEELKREVESERKQTTKQPRQRAAHPIVKALEAKASEARTRLAGKFLTPSPQDLFDLATISAFRIAEGVASFSDWSKEMIDAFTDKVQPYLQAAWEQGKEIARQSSLSDITDKLKAKLEAGKLDSVSPLLNKLAKQFIAGGTHDYLTLIGQLHDVLKSIDPTITQEQTMDAYAGYGKFKTLSKNAIDVENRDIKGQVQKVRKLLDMFQGARPKKSGIEMPIPSDTQRRLIAIVNAAKKSFGLEVQDLATQLKSALGSIKTRLANQIADLEHQISTRTKTVRDKTPSPSDAETEALRAQRDALKKQFDAIFPRDKNPLTDEQRIAAATRSVQASIEDYESRIKAGDISSKKSTSKTPETPELKALRARRDALQDELQELKDLANPKKTPEERALQSAKKRMTKRIADLEERTANGDFSPRPQRPLKLDAEGVKKQEDLKAAELKYREARKKDRLKNRTTTQKIQDATVKWSRINKLSSLTVFPKLIEAGIVRIITNPINRILAQPLRAVPGLAQKAPYQLRVSPTAEIKSLTAVLTSGPQALKKLLTGKSSIDIAAGKPAQVQEMANFVGNAHGAIKEPVRQGAYARSVEVNLQEMNDAGIDTTEPVAQAAAVSSAVSDADHEIFMGKNPITTYLHDIPMAAIRNADFVGAKSLANTIDFLTPIVRVTTNIGIHAMRLNPAVGFTEAFSRLAVAAKRGELADRSAKLSREDASAIARAFGAGMLGTILAAYAWTNPQHFGGEFNDEEKKKKGGLKFGEIKIMGKVIPSWMNHAPEISWLNTVASARRIYDRYYTTHPNDKLNAETSALAFSIMAPVKNFPFVDTWLRIYGEHQTMGQAAGQITRDALIPGAVTRTLQATDSKQRAPKNFTQEVEMGIPGLRKNVPVKVAVKRLPIPPLR